MLLLQPFGRLLLVAVLWISVSVVNKQIQQSNEPILMIRLLNDWITVLINGTGTRDFDIIKFEFQQFADVPTKGTLKMFRGENREHKFNMTMTITSDDLSIYDVEATLYRSAMGNNQFVLSPFKIPRKPLCDLFNNEYRDRAMDDIAKHSNFPSEHDKNINYCDLLKKDNHYELINYVGNVSMVPPYAPIGTFKFVGSIIDRNTNAVAMSVMVISKLF